ncbi:hypothetical protein FOMA001_g17360 [Fusarium oxysporum f. sp. matthiolae]|nr:hypothetical protein FOMA001_g17360 [Fusarium oxysporum f. sp. matthiolae]
MALFCCRYLSSRPFATGKSQSISADVQSGYFGFLDYAAAHYIVHIREVETSEVSTYSASRLEAVKAAVVGLAKANCKEISLQAEQGDKTTKDLNLAIQGNVLTVRALIGLQQEKSETAIFEATEGPKRQKCHKIQCSKFATGCSNETALKEQLAVHERPFRCPHTDCFAHAVGYASSKRLENHNEAFHHTTSKAKAKAVFPAELETGEWNLYEACKAGNLDEVKKFHREGADLNSIHPEAVSPFCAAVELGMVMFAGTSSITELTLFVRYLTEWLLELQSLQRFTENIWRFWNSFCIAAVAQMIQSWLKTLPTRYTRTAQPP